MADHDSESSEQPTPGSGRPYLSWPPPGLGRLQGDLWEIIKQAALGAVFLVSPLLWATATQQEFWSLGPFGASWWVVLPTASVGLAIMASAFIDVFRLFRRSARAADRGYGWRTVAAVAVDATRDTGFLLQGARAFSVLPPSARARLLAIRLWSGLLTLLGVFWLPVGFALGVLLAAREALSPSGLTLFTLVPALLLILAGVVLRWLDSRTSSKAKREWFKQPWSRDLAQDEVASWNQAYEDRRNREMPEIGAADTGRTFRMSAALVLILAIVVFVSFLTLVFTTTLGPLVASVAVPDYTATQRRAASAEAYRHLVVAPSEDITPQESGEILHSLTFAGMDREVLPFERPPADIHEQAWIPDLRGGPTGVFPARWSADFIRRAPQGLEEAEVEFLQDVADHPAIPDFRRLATAPAVDVAAGRWELPFPDGTTIIDLPLPELVAVRQASWAMVGVAALAASEGRIDEAERILREIISVGFLLGDDSPTVVGNLVGFVLVTTGGEALENLYAGSGRDQEAEALMRARRATERTSEVSRVGFGSDLEGSLRVIPEVVENSRGIRGLRWSYFAVMNTLAPCLNTHKMVFGPGDEYERWVDRARAGLVRWNSEAELFDLSRNGWYVGKGESRRNHGLLGTVLGLTLGGQGQAGSCAAFVGNLRGEAG